MSQPSNTAAQLHTCHHIVIIIAARRKDTTKRSQTFSAAALLGLGCLCAAHFLSTSTIFRFKLSTSNAHDLVLFQIILCRDESESGRVYLLGIIYINNI